MQPVVQSPAQIKQRYTIPAKSLAVITAPSTVQRAPTNRVRPSANTKA